MFSPGLQIVRSISFSNLTRKKSTNGENQTPPGSRISRLLNSSGNVPKSSIVHGVDIKNEKMENPEKPESKEIYLKENMEVAVATKAKKLVTFRRKEVVLYGDRIELIEKREFYVIYLTSLCMIQQVEALNNSGQQGSSQLKSSAPFKDAKDRSARTILLCTQEVTRFWLTLDNKNSLLLWILSIDGLLNTNYQASLLDTAFKVNFFFQFFFFFFSIFSPTPLFLRVFTISFHKIFLLYILMVFIFNFFFLLEPSAAGPVRFILPWRHN